MSETITTRLDELADGISADIDAGREPDTAMLEEYAECLGDFLRGYPIEATAWLREVYRRAA